MSLPWFRVYRELKDDPKMGELSDASFRVFIESLCWACEQERMGLTGLRLDNANWAFRRNVIEPLQDLLQRQMLSTTSDGEIMVPKWEKRQKSSDSSAERVRKYRAKKNVTLPETLLKRPCNGAEESRVEEIREEKTVVAVAPVRQKFTRPTMDELRFAMEKAGCPETEAVKFFNYYESNGWRVGRNPMRSWPHAVGNWASNFRTKQPYGKINTTTRPDRNAGTYHEGKSTDDLQSKVR